MINVFVVGLDSFNLELLQLLPSNENYAFKALLSYEEAVFRNGGEIDFPGILEMAEKPLAAASDSVDAIIGYWDFPTCSLVPILRQKQRLPGPRLEAVAACEHKYWSRMVQQSAIPEYVPRFCAVDPFDTDPLSQIDMPYPFWIKPIKAHSSYLGFKIHDRTEFDVAIEAIRANIEHFAVPFDTFLSMVNVPANIANVRGRYCIAEEIISSAHQCTLEGYVFQGDVTVYGVVDSIREGKHHSCFSRYQYPSQIPQPVQNRMIEAAQQFLQYIGYSNATFNMEFFWEPSTNTIRLLEVNPRISKSHSPLFYLVDGAAHQKIDIDLGAALLKRRYRAI
jgi:biotin carboxylase